MNDDEKFICIESKRCRLMNHPSLELSIPCEPIPDCGLSSIRSSSGYLCHFHHHHHLYPFHYKSEGGKPPLSSFSTRIEVLCLATQNNVIEMFYRWNGVPEWAVNPTCQNFDVAICRSIVAFITSEKYLAYFNLPASFDTSLCLIDLSPHLPDELSELTPTRISIACTDVGNVSVLCSFFDFGFTSIIIICQPSNGLNSTTGGKKNSVVNIQCYLNNNGQQLYEISRLFGNHSVTASRDYYFTSFNYYDYSETLKLAILVLPKKSTGMIEYFPVSPKCKHDNTVGMTLSNVSYNENTCTLSCHPFGCWKFSNMTNVLFDLAVSLSTPFVSLIHADVSNMYTLSAKLNSPWAMPVALVHILLFLIFFPFIILPGTKTDIEIMAKNDNLKVTDRTRFTKRGLKGGNNTLVGGTALCDPDGDNSENALPMDLVIVEQTSKFTRLRKYSPDVRTKLIYSKSKTLRSLSIFSYLMCMAGFSMSMWFILTRIKNLKFDLLAQLGIADAASIFTLAISQDLVSFIPCIEYYCRKKKLF